MSHARSRGRALTATTEIRPVAVGAVLFFRSLHARAMAAERHSDESQARTRDAAQRAAEDDRRR